MASTTASTALKSALHIYDQLSIIPSGLTQTVVQHDGYDLTDIAAEIRSLEHFDAQILLHFTHDLYGVVKLEVCVLWKLSTTVTVCIYSLGPRSSRYSTSSHLPVSYMSRFSYLPTFCVRVGAAYPVQVYVYAPARINRGCFSAQRHYSAEDADGLVGEGVEVFGVDSGSGFGGHVKESGRERDEESCKPLRG